MAKRGDFTGNADGARQYLANLIASDQWTAAKNLDDYKDDQIIRKANTFRQQERANVPISNKAARGHADIIPTRPTAAPTTRRPTPTNGPAATIPTQRQRKDVTIIPPPRIPLDRSIHGPNGSSQYSSTRFNDVLKQMRGVEKARPDAQVYFSLWDNRKGKMVKMYVEKGRIGRGNQGVNLQDIMTRIRDKIRSGQAKTQREALIDIWDEDIDGDVAGEDTSDDDMEMPEVFSTIGFHVIGY